MEIEDIKTHIDENHASKAGQNIKSIVFGGVDGVITTFSIMAAAVGASLDVKVIILLGVSNLLADAFSMGFGDYLSSTSERNYIISERDKEIKEYDENRQYEMEELITLYKEKGMEEGDARSFIGILASKPAYKDLFILHMMQHELELPEPDDTSEIVRKSLFTFLSFILFGSLPLWVYLIVYMADLDNNGVVFAVACICAALTLFLIGAVGAVLTKQSIWRNGFLTFSNGLVAAFIAYFLGWGIESAL
mmetsp:Transcript_59735/g.67946  ORF Transcript_59735/g.67946 Transcript_59735/m.67946 type:complete len:249 (-) Transcript_59735:151-897(-)